MSKGRTYGPTRATAKQSPVLTAGGRRDAEIATPTRLFTFLLEGGGRGAQEENSAGVRKERAGDGTRDRLALGQRQADGKG